jgi:hypothetical protein
MRDKNNDFLNCLYSLTGDDKNLVPDAGRLLQLFGF